MPDVWRELALQPPRVAPIEFAQGRESDMADIQIEAHADGIGCNKIIDIAVQEHLHLRIAGRGRQRAHHHRRSAAQSPEHFRHRVDLFG